MLAKMSCTTCLMASLLNAPLIRSKPMKIKPIPQTMPPMFLTLGLLKNCIMTPIKARTETYRPISKLDKETSKPVTVVPIFAPMITAVAWARVIVPILTKPITMTVVAALDWIKAVTVAPIPTPAKRFLVILPISCFIPGPATFCKDEERKFIPTMNTPIPANRLKILVNISMLTRVLYKETIIMARKSFCCHWSQDGSI